MNDEISKRVRAFTVKQGAVTEKEVMGNPCLERDLGIYGDDAIEFIVAFGKEFNVDVSTFRAAEYFNPEGDFILPMIIRFFTGKRQKKNKELTLEHLEKAVIAGRLDEDVING